MFTLATVNIATLLGTLLGGLIGIGSSTLTERSRRRRDREDRMDAALREAFIGFDRSITEAGLGIRRAVREARNSNANVELAVRLALTSSGLFTAYHRLCLLAGEQIILNANSVVKRFEAIRDLLIGGDDLSSAAYQEARTTLFTEHAILRNAMREELGLTAVSLHAFITDRYS